MCDIYFPKTVSSIPRPLHPALSLVAMSPHQIERQRGRRRSTRYYDESNSDYSSDERNIPQSRRKSLGHEVIHQLGGAIGLRSNSSRRRARSESRRHSSSGPYENQRWYSLSPPPTSRRRYKSPAPRQPGMVEQAADAAIDAGTVTAFRLRKVPGPWIGDKGVRVATAALSAAAIDVLIDKDPAKYGTRNIAASTIGGLIVDRIANGSRREQRRHRYMP